MGKRLRWKDLHIGDKAGPIQYTITGEIIDAFAEATEDFCEWHMKGSPFDSRIAHPCLTITDYSLLLSPIHGSQTGLHSRQESEFFHPMRLGDLMTARGEIVELYQRRGYDFYAILYECINTQGLVAIRHKLTTTVTPEGPPPQIATTERPRPASSENAKASAAPATGPELPPLTRAFTKEAMVKFGNQTGLRVGRRGPAHSTHTDLDVARSAGLPDVVVQATQYYSWYSEMMLKFLGEGWVCGGKISAKFFGIVFPGDALTLRGKVTDVKKEGTDTRVYVELQAIKRDGQPVSTATASGLAGRRIPGPGWPVSKVPVLR